MTDGNEEDDDYGLLLHYRTVQPCLKIVRILDRVMDRLDERELGDAYDEIWSTFQDVVNEELAPWALLLARAIADLERKFQFSIPEPPREMAG